MMSCAEPIAKDCGAVLPKMSLVRSSRGFASPPFAPILRRCNAPKMLAIGSYAMPAYSRRLKNSCEQCSHTYCLPTSFLYLPHTICATTACKGNSRTLVTPQKEAVVATQYWFEHHHVLRWPEKKDSKPSKIVSGFCTSQLLGTALFFMLQLV